MSYPRLTLPVALTATSPHIRITYDDASTQNVTLSAATFYPDGSGSGSDLLKELADELTSDEVVGATWTVTDNANGTVTIAASGGSKAAVSLTFLRTELRASDLGLINPGGSNTVALTSQSVTGSYRRRWMWQPEVIYTQYHKEPTRWLEIAEGGTGAQHNATYYGVSYQVELELQKVAAARVFKHYADNSLFATASGLPPGDDNATLEQFIDDAIAAITSRRMPLVRFARDKASPATYETFRFTDPERIATFSGGGVTRANRGPLLYDIALNGRTTS